MAGKTLGFTEEIWLQIRADYEEGYTVEQLSVKYGCHAATIGRHFKKRGWAFRKALVLSPKKAQMLTVSEAPQSTSPSGVPSSRRRVIPVGEASPFYERNK